MQEEEIMKRLKKGIARLGKMMRERKRQRALEAHGTMDNYTLFGSIVGGYCGLLSTDRRDR